MNPRPAVQIDDWEALDVGVEILDVIDKSERLPPQLTSCLRICRVDEGQIELCLV